MTSHCEQAEREIKIKAIKDRVEAAFSEYNLQAEVGHFFRDWHRVVGGEAYRCSRSKKVGRRLP